MVIKKIIGGIASGAVGYLVGDTLGKALHDLIVYMPIREFSKYQWFDPKQYIKLYNQYSVGLRDTMGLIMGITGLGISLLLYLELIGGRNGAYKR
ncbi:hypothetical protein DRO54_10320 [Candidatus Bathyarchaeota archaeon]|nr:MAG: hypothetical protein DRO54_10320 [Candidatus Bathyarchaeota archaeon]